jgi:hypothetical protein
LKFAAGNCCTTGFSAQPAKTTRPAMTTREIDACLAIHGPMPLLRIPLRPLLDEFDTDDVEFATDRLA